MQSASLSKAQGVAPFQSGPKSSRAAGRRRATAVVPRAVAVKEEAVDVGALFRDALSAPVVKKAAAPAAAPAPAPPAPVAAPPPPAVAPPAASVTVDPVPGTEILSSAPTPQPPAPPAAATQGMDLVLQRLQAKPPGFEEPAETTTQAAKAAAKPLTEGLGDSLASAGKGLGDAGAAATKGLSDAGAAATKSLSSAADSVGDAAGAVTSALGDAASSAAEAANQAAAAASAAADALTSVFSGATSGAAGAASGLADGAVGAASGFVGAAVEEFNTEVGIIKANIGSLVGGITSAVGGTTSAVSSSVSTQVSGVVDQVSSLLPPEAQQALAAAGAAAAAAATQLAGVARQLAGTDAAVDAALAGVGVGLPALLIWRAVYGGYAGNLTAEEALEVLQKENALLLDVRTEAQRLDKGVAELRRGARGKGAAVPPVQLPPSLARRLRDPAAAALEIHALEIAGLGKVNPSATKVIVMDAQGERAKTLARALRNVGVQRPYVLTGGFKAWAAANAVKEKSTEYDASALDAVGDVAETVAEEAATRLAVLKEPRNAALAAAAAGGIGFFALNFHTTLQFLGVLGLELTLVNRALSYSSLQDALDDAAALYKGAANLATLPLKAAEALGGAGQRTAAPAAPRRQAAGESEA